MTLVALTWIGILLCLSQSALLSGLNLGLFTLSKLELQVEAKKGNAHARKVLRLRERANLMLVTILWGNVAVNVLLALLSDSVLAGVLAFLFSTVVITVFAEIIPQSFFSRHALSMVGRLAPLLLFYRVLLYPVAGPTAWVLDRWLGGEEIRYFRERDLRRLIQLHMEAAESDIARVEGQGALNFLAIDDVPLDDEGEILEESSIVPLEFDGCRPVFPPIRPAPDDPFLHRINESGTSWVVLTDEHGLPRLLLRAENFLREALFASRTFDPAAHCHEPILVRDGGRKLGELLPQIRVVPGNRPSDRVVNSAILLWGPEPRIITATDIMERLLRGITATDEPPEMRPGVPGR